MVKAEYAEIATFNSANRLLYFREEQVIILLMEGHQPMPYQGEAAKLFFKDAQRRVEEAPLYGSIQQTDVPEEVLEWAKSRAFRGGEVPDSVHAALRGPSDPAMEYSFVITSSRKPL